MDTKFFRGHTHECYTLKPGISRGITDYKVIEKCERELFEAFKHEIYSQHKEKHFNSPNNYKFCFTNEWEWYFQAQHCGLLTRLLDWTISWDTAISFAIGSDIRNDDIDGAIWICRPLNNYIQAVKDEDVYKNRSPFALSVGIFIYAPVVSDDSENYNEKLGAQRLLCQWGKFSVQSYMDCVIPMEEQKGLKDCLEKIIIPSKLKKELRKLGDFRLKDEEIYTETSFGIDEIAKKVNTEFIKSIVK